MRTLISISILMSSIALIISCTYHKEFNEPTDPSCGTVPYRFSADVLPILSANCMNGCHVQNGSAPGDYSQYAAVKTAVDNGQLRLRTIIMRDMPPSGPLPDALLKKIDCWIADGGLNN